MAKCMQIIKKIQMDEKKGELIMKQKGHERNKKRVRERERDQKITKRNYNKTTKDEYLS